MRTSLRLLSFVLLAACADDAKQDHTDPGPVASVENRPTPAAPGTETKPPAPAPSDPAVETPTSTNDWKTTLGAKIPTSLDDATVAAQCANTPAAVGTTKLTPATPALEGRLEPEASVRVDASGGVHLDLTIFYPTSNVEDPTYGKASSTTWGTFTFDAPTGSQLDAGTYNAIKATSKAVQFACWSAGSQLSTYDEDASSKAGYTLGITSKSETKVEGWFEKTEGDKTIRVDFSAPISNAVATRLQSVCCLK